MEYPRIFCLEFEYFFSYLVGELAAVGADLVGLGIADGLTLFFAHTLDQLFSEASGGLGKTNRIAAGCGKDLFVGGLIGDIHTLKPLEALFGGLGDGFVIGKGQPLVDLRNVKVGNFHLDIENVGNVNENVGSEGRILELILIIKDNGGIGHSGNIGALVRNDEHIGGVLHKDSCGTVVGVVVVLTVSNNDVGRVFSYISDEAATSLKVGLDRAVVNIPYVVGNAEKLCYCGRFLGTGGGGLLGG